MEMITIMVHFSGVLAEMTGIKDDEWEIPKGLTYTHCWKVSKVNMVKRFITI